MTRIPVPGNSPGQLGHGGDREIGLSRRGRSLAEVGFTLIEVLIASMILAGAFIALSTSFPLAALTHRMALEKEVAAALAQDQMEYFLANPGPLVGTTGVKSDFVNAADFPPDFTGAFSAVQFNGVPGLTQIVVSVTPPHGQKVEISAIDTTYSNLVP